MKAIAMMLAVATAGCAPVTAHEAETAAAPAGGGSCDAVAAQALIGRSASDALLQETKRLSGAATARYLRPGQVVTMEYRFDRVNLNLDANDVVESVTCG